MPAEITRRVSKLTGAVTWQVRVKLGPGPDGKPRELVKTYKLQREAKAYVEDTRKDIRGGKVVEPSKLTLGEYLDRWLEDAAKPALRANTLESYSDYLKLYVRPELAGFKLDQLSPLVLQRFVNGMTEKGLAPRTVRYAFSVLAAALKQAVKWRILQFSHCAAVELPKPKRREMQALGRVGAAAFLEAAEGTRHAALFKLLLGTGMRPSEALGLLWTDVDLDRGAVAVQRSLVRTREGWQLAEPKTARSRRVVPIPAGVTEALRQHRATQLEARMKLGRVWENHGLVFTNEVGGPLDGHNILNRHFRPLLLKARLPKAHVDACEQCTAKKWRQGRGLCDEGAKLRALAAAEVAGLRLYDLRHSAATLLIQAGTHVKVVSERLGHASAMMTLDVYSHVLPDMQREASDKMESILFGGGK